MGVVGSNPAAPIQPSCFPNLNLNNSGYEPAAMSAFLMRSASVGAGHKKMAGGINLKPSFIAQLTQRAGKDHPCDAEGTGDVLMGEAEVDVDPQTSIKGLSKSKVGDQGCMPSTALRDFSRMVPRRGTKPKTAARSWVESSSM